MLRDAHIFACSPGRSPFLSTETTDTDILTFPFGYRADPGTKKAPRPPRHHSKKGALRRLEPLRSGPVIQ
eukprot:scaffold32111_cov26-Tisochrysis_lutea.AAC.2